MHRITATGPDGMVNGPAMLKRQSGLMRVVHSPRLTRSDFSHLPHHSHTETIVNSIIFWKQRSKHTAHMMGKATKDEGNRGPCACATGSSTELSTGNVDYTRTSMMNPRAGHYGCQVGGAYV